MIESSLIPNTRDEPGAQSTKQGLTVAHLCMLAFSLLIPLPLWAGRADLNSTMQLGSLFIEDIVNEETEVCTERFPETKTSWSTASNDWHQNHRDELLELRQTQRTLEAALKKNPSSAYFNLAQYTGFRFQGTMLVMYGLAIANDHKAGQLCEDLKTKYLDDGHTKEVVNQAKRAAAAALQLLSAP
jgi:hypothetical protein